MSQSRLIQLLPLFLELEASAPKRTLPLKFRIPKRLANTVPSRPVLYVLNSHLLAEHDTGRAAHFSECFSLSLFRYSLACTLSLYAAREDSFRLGEGLAFRLGYWRVCEDARAIQRAKYSASGAGAPVMLVTTMFTRRSNLTFCRYP